MPSGLPIGTFNYSLTVHVPTTTQTRLPLGAGCGDTMMMKDKCNLSEG